MAGDSFGENILRNFERRLNSRADISPKTLEALDFDPNSEDFGDDEELLTKVSGVDPE